MEKLSQPLPGVTCLVKTLTVWRSTRPVCTSCELLPPGPLFSASFLRFGRSKHIQISSQCICAGHGKSGARGSRGQLWVQPRAVGRSPAKSHTLPLAKRKRVCLFFFNVSFRETKRTRPSHTEASVRPVHLKTLYTAPFLAPASCPGSSEVHQACYRMSS